MHATCHTLTRPVPNFSFPTSAENKEFYDQCDPKSENLCLYGVYCLTPNTNTFSSLLASLKILARSTSPSSIIICRFPFKGAHPFQIKQPPQYPPSQTTSFHQAMYYPFTLLAARTAPVMVPYPSSNLRNTQYGDPQSPGEPDGSWTVDQPAEEVPAELPEPCLGINFARDGMQRRDWLSLVAVHSDAWLLRCVVKSAANPSAEH